MLKSVRLGFRKSKIQRLRVVELGMYNRRDYGVGSVDPLKSR